MLVALGIQGAMSMRHIAICALPRPPINSKRHDFRKRKVFEQKMCVSISCTTFVRNISYSKKNWARRNKKCKTISM